MIESNKSKLQKKEKKDYIKIITKYLNLILVSRFWLVELKTLKYDNYFK